ncbi:MAG: 2,3-bisphosphoglycerate-dependent phosphoglycerate mutase [bacterium]|nr:2,3-bisphosphoglycerate-dependent phosphoglycerate mutase [bacterium]
MPGGYLVILRHGESTFNAAQVFTGLLDADVTAAGLAQVVEAARLMVQAGLTPERIVTSPMLRALRTTERLIAELGSLGALPEAPPSSGSPLFPDDGASPLPIHVSWRLNERDYGILTGVPKAEARERYGEDAFFTWRRTLHGRPPAATPEQAAGWTAPPPVAERGTLVPGQGESLADVIDRVTPFWEWLAPQVESGACIGLVAHGNTLRALAAVMDGLGASEVEELNIPAGHPLVYRVHGGLASPRGGFYLDDDAAQIAADKVAAEGGT